MDSMEKKLTTIPAGYRITVDSWENDGDNGNTAVKEGLTLNEARFYFDVCALCDMGTEFGNMYEPDDPEILAFGAAFVDVCDKHKNNINEILSKYDYEWSETDKSNDEELDDAAGFAVEILYDFGLAGSDFYTRTVSEIKVEYVPQEIVLEDVTSMFNEKE